MVWTYHLYFLAFCTLLISLFPHFPIRGHKITFFKATEYFTETKFLKGVGEGRRGYGEINNEGRRLELGWWTHNTLYRGCTIELCTRNRYNFINQCHPNKFNKKEKKYIGKKYLFSPYFTWLLSRFNSIIHSLLLEILSLAWRIPSSPPISLHLYWLFFLSSYLNVAVSQQQDPNL